MKRKKPRCKRIFSIGIAFSLLFSALVGRLFYVMSIHGSNYRTLAVQQQTKSITIAPYRGEILDRNGLQLALSINVYRIDADLTVLNKYLVDNKIPEGQASEKLAKILNVKSSDVEKILNTQNSEGKLLQFVSLKRQVEQEVVDSINNLKYKGIIISSDVKRIYPNDTFLSQVLGHINLNGSGVNGVELSYNNYLAGTPGVKVVQLDRFSNELPYTEAVTVNPINGKNLTLTIDEQIQELAERVAKETLEENGAKSVSITIMNPNNGEVLAMANSPGYNLNEPYAKGNTSSQSEATWRNTAVSDVFEPGSIFKVIMAAAGLQYNSVTDKYLFTNNGSIKIGNKTLYNDNKEQYGVETFSDILKNSDNVGFITLGQMIGKENLYKFAKDAGIGKKTNIDLPGEGTGLIKDLKSITPLDLATMSYGQGVAVTQIQYMAAFNAVANGGTLITPHVMKEISHNINGKTVVDNKYSNFNKRTIMSSSKSALLRTYLETVVKKGTAAGTYMAGYHIGGKTGTANKVDSVSGGYISGKYISSFAGIAPASNPKVSLIVTIEEPNSDNYYAAQTAVPASKKIFSELFTIMGISPDNVNSTVNKNATKKN
ncbi:MULTISPECIES: peptidoglycan D,D-transpeptidase FtsI family protein [Clostridium]|uniref:Penicillin-binding transpeptidase domain-containing protein n=1 Tax=Clostridium frigoriphilum TaxID=443253 RepID=A0ABU7UN65_9CLOT|nr:penicillin-binding transpeptidase domain-containing protein [Clostridium sp. DSM 17811]MBU3099818.1 penicillin-binding protein 2 [Clostridium sp. DSM 17811]